jgi:hypothetical protein
MKTLKEIVDQGLVDTISVDPTMDERYGDKPLFQHKIDRLYELLKDTPLSPNSKKQSLKSASSTPTDA